MEERIAALEEKFADLETRVAQLEQYVGINEFDFESQGASLHRRLDYLEDWRRDSYAD